jgi:hypothetical protein
MPLELTSSGFISLPGRAGDPIYVKLDKIQHVSHESLPECDWRGVVIWFNARDGVAVSGTLEEVMAIITAADK